MNKADDFKDYVVAGGIAIALIIGLFYLIKKEYRKSAAEKCATDAGSNPESSCGVARKFLSAMPESWDFTGITGDDDAIIATAWLVKDWANVVFAYKQITGGRHLPTDISSVLSDNEEQQFYDIINK
jgi:hypothetical protein